VNTTTTPDTLAQQVAVHRAHVIADDEALAVVQRIAPRLTSTSDGDFVLNGVKHYSTGALFTHWIGVLARNDHDQPQVEFVRIRSRPWFEAPVDSAAEDLLLIQRAGELAVRLRSAEAALAAAARSIDAARADLNDDTGATRVPTPCTTRCAGSCSTSAASWCTAPCHCGTG
jgi:alkylation response protein AidB-like acyl-CoA dehydrogenase